MFRLDDLNSSFTYPPARRLFLPPIVCSVARLFNINSVSFVQGFIALLARNELYSGTNLPFARIPRSAEPSPLQLEKLGK